MRGRAVRISKLLLLASALASTAPVAIRAEPELVFNFSQVNAGAAAAFRRDIEEARRRVRDWWGPTFEDRIAVETTAAQVYSMALVPAWRGERGRMIFGSRRVNAREAAAIHEMIHVYAPNANRMLAEGLAVYGHDTLGGNRAYPNFGADIHRLAAPLATKAVLLTLERVGTPDPLEKVLPDGEAVAGSFVRFLIERFGVEKFRALYDLTPLRVRERDAGEIARWHSVYGKTLEEIADEWLAAIRPK